MAVWEHQLFSYATERLSSVGGLRIIGTASQKTSLIGFTLEGVHPHDIGTVLDDLGVAIRAGHHCAQPVMRHFGVPATARASFAFYNTMDEVDVLADAIGRIGGMFH
jgi:cysteine desulfurase/selenocysteine lyase